jgi:hypothetical protein
MRHAATTAPLISDPLNIELVEEFELTCKTQIQRMSEKLVIVDLLAVSGE